MVPSVSEAKQTISECLRCYITAPDYIINEAHLSSQLLDKEQSSSGQIKIEANIRFANEKVSSGYEFFLRDAVMDGNNSDLMKNKIRTKLNLILCYQGEYCISVLTTIDINPSNAAKFDFITFELADQYEEIVRLFNQ